MDRLAGNMRWITGLKSKEPDRSSTVLAYRPSTHDPKREAGGVIMI